MVSSAQCSLVYCSSGLLIDVFICQKKSVLYENEYLGECENTPCTKGHFVLVQNFFDITLHLIMGYVFDFFDQDFGQRNQNVLILMLSSQIYCVKIKST